MGIENDPVERLKNIERHHQEQRHIKTPDWQERERALHAGEIQDDRVQCQGCAKYDPDGMYGRKCAEGIAIHPTILRRCIRWMEIKETR